MGDDHGWDEVAYNGHPYVHQAESLPDVTERMQTQLRDWQRSVLKILTGADYVMPSNHQKIQGPADL